MSATFAVIPALAATVNPGVYRTVSKLSPSVVGSMQEGQESVDVIIRTDGDYAPAKEAIRSLGGTIRYEYRFVDYLAATLPSSGVFTVASLPSVERIMLDEVIQPAIPLEDRPLASGLDPMSEIFATAFALDAEPLAILEANSAPSNYFNSIAADVTTSVLTASGEGDDTVLAVIDTGIFSGHFLLGGGRVIGGDDVSPDVGTPFEGFDRADNHYHGSFVSAVAAGKGAACFLATGLLATSIEFHTGLTLSPCAGGIGKVVPLSGIAPETLLVGYKVFPHTGAGVPSSIIDVAIERVIENKTEDGFDIDVVNMSLGGAALFDGREAQEALIDLATSLDITFVIAAGNDGPASMTVASPGVTNTAITVAATQHPVNSRVFWDQVFGFLGAGSFAIVSSDIQAISFSSRGPASDGAAKPDITATGTVLLSAFPSLASPGGLAFASGTSFSTPTVAGAVSLLNSGAEKMGLGASPFDYKEALMAGADPSLVPGYDVNEIGAGYLQVGAAWSALLADPAYGSVQSPLGPAPFDIVDITTGGFSATSHGDITVRTIETSVTLAPGAKEEFVFESSLSTHRIVLDLKNVELGANVLGIDSLEVYIHNAKRGGSFFDYYVDSTNVFGDTTFRITDNNVVVTSPGQQFRNDAPLVADVIEPGFQKVIVENDWTSSDVISVDIELTVRDRPRPQADATFSGAVMDGDTDFIFFTVPRNTKEMDIFLAWENDWSKLPTHDLDLIVAHFDRKGALDFLSFQGATLDSPERAVIDGLPKGGTWLILVDGFTVFQGENEPYTVWVFFR